MRPTKKIFQLRVGAEIEVRLKAAVAPLLKQIVPLYSTVFFFLNFAAVFQDIQEGLVEKHE